MSREIVNLNQVILADKIDDIKKDEIIRKSKFIKKFICIVFYNHNISIELFTEFINTYFDSLDTTLATIANPIKTEITDSSFNLRL